MAETRKLAAILAADVVGYSRLAASDEERTLARLRALRSDLIDPTIAVHNGRVVKRIAITAISADAINPLADTMTNMTYSSQKTGDNRTSLGVKLRAD